MASDSSRAFLAAQPSKDLERGGSFRKPCTPVQFANSWERNHDMICFQNTTLWRRVFSQCSSLLTNLLSMRWRYSYLRISRHRIDIAMSPASPTWTEQSFREGGVDEKNRNWWP